MLGSSARIEAAQVWGALRALETFSQLVEYDSAAGLYYVQCVPVRVTDAPKYKWR